MKKNLLLVVIVLFLLCGSNSITYYFTNQKTQVPKNDLASVVEHQSIETTENNNLNRGEDLNNSNIVTKEKERPELLTLVNCISSNQYWDETIMSNISEAPIFDEGFLSKPSNKKLVLQILNTTQEDIENVSVKFTITTFKHYITFGIDKLDIVAYQPTPYKEVTNNIRIETIKSNELVELDVFYMATFPQVKVKVESINITKNSVISEPLIYYYCSDEFESIGDIQDLRQLLGITYRDATIEENK